MGAAADRRRFPRVLAPVYYRPAGPAFLHHRRAAVDVSLGGMRVYSDEALAVGTSVELELLLDSESSAICWARVAWIEPLDGSAGAQYDIGLEFTDLDELFREQLGRVLEGGQT